MPFSKEETDQLQSAITAALASARLNQWQRTFLSDMQTKFEQYGTRAQLSEKQYAKLREILSPFRNNDQLPLNSPKKSPPQDRSQNTPVRRRISPKGRAKSPSPSKTTKKLRYGYKNAMVAVVAIGMGLTLLASLFGEFGLDFNRQNSISDPAQGVDQTVFTSARQFSVTDGDTVQLYSSGKGTRLVGFNTPETYRPRCDQERFLGQRATNRLKELVSNAGKIELHLVRCACPPGTEGTNDCNFGRSCGLLWVDGRDVGDVLISEGLAVRFQCGQTSCPRLPNPWCG